MKATQQQTIRFDEVLGTQARPVDLTAPLRRAAQSVTRWLDSPSEFYSRLLGDTITWRKALRIGVTLPCLTVLTAACAWQAPLVTAYSLAASAWIVYRLNQEEKGGAA